MEREQFTTKLKTVELPIVSTQEIYVYLSEYLNYLTELHKRYAVCVNKKEEIDKEILEIKIAKLTDRVYALKSILDKKKQHIFTDEDLIQN